MLEKPRLVRFGNLDAILLFNDDPKALTVICLHGYGADMHDLSPLAVELAVKRPLTWLFPDAPLLLEWGGRAWFPIDAAAFEESQRSGAPRDLTLRAPEGMAAARAELGLFLKARGEPWENIVLMGFSQGAMMAVDMALRAEDKPAGAVILSGTLVDKKTTEALAPKKKGLPFFQTHGSADPLLGFKSALALTDALVTAGWCGELQRFEGGHAVPPEALETLRVWLEAR